MKKLILILIIFCLFIKCNKNKLKTEINVKTENVFAQNKYDFGGSVDFRMFSDSTYNFISIEKSSNYEKTEKYSGFYEIKKDTIYFKPFEFKFVNSNKAVIKNNFIEFISEDKKFRIEIVKSNLQINNRLDFTNFKDYAIFTYKKENSEYKPYDIDQNELIELDKIMWKCFTDNKSKLNAKTRYVKQCVIVTNTKNEIEVWVNCFCKSDHIEKKFKQNQIGMKDGGNCNISMKINLTKKNYSELKIAGSA